MSYKDTNWKDPRTGKPKDAPCAFLDWNEITRRYMKKTPLVNCDGHCDRCGFNPEVKERRIKKMTRGDGDA